MQQNNQNNYIITTKGQMFDWDEKNSKLLINKQEFHKTIDKYEDGLIKSIEKEKSIFVEGTNKSFKNPDFTKIAWEKEKQLCINEEKWKIGKKLLEEGLINEFFKDTNFKFDTNKILLDCGLEPGRKDLARFEKKLRENPLINHPEVIEMEKSINEYAKKNGQNKEANLTILMKTMDFVSYSKSKNQQQNIKKGVENATNSKNVVKNVTKQSKEEEPCCKSF